MRQAQADPSQDHRQAIELRFEVGRFQIGMLQRSDRFTPRPQHAFRLRHMFHDAVAELAQRLTFIMRGMREPADRSAVSAGEIKGNDIHGNLPENCCTAV